VERSVVPDFERADKVYAFRPGSLLEEMREKSWLNAHEFCGSTN